MDLRQLAALMAIDDTGSFSAAAKQLHTVQSNVSTHVARLERELSAVLVDRPTGRLTPEGRAVVARARRVQAELDALVADVASLRDEVSGAVRMGIIGTTGRWLLPPLLAAMRDRYPLVAVAVLEGNTTSLLPQLRAGSLDLAVVNLPADDPEITLDILFEEDLMVVAPLDHPLAGHGRVGLAQLAEHELLLPPPGTSIRVELDRAAAAEGVTLVAKAELDGLRLIASLALEGFGAAVLPATAVPSWMAGAWRVVPIEGAGRRQVSIARRRAGLPSVPARATHQVVTEVVATQADAQAGVHLTGEDQR
ncbi:MAG TPA: LysR substrate-binding domain-containing protein [Acidimicrobiales bacterium]|nr:LysR substrate-binding domain-containing protein [Acidimicrobiales bacterium]